ncbi:hypothetical protein OZ411_35990 [Bradyrhizobium sp. Arg237L]|uniref:hypothetical protein n=1 Tax=Bradyrhizobium sp. Arg237L TaxID=3003352 RepID=UPI00249DC735|nr:hypothetical protein [Bradyrhizobium sp. Arg237L]MDI4238216.1 hypothetical protein [Bradyrhizobium sp. Arg237L]
MAMMPPAMVVAAVPTVVMAPVPTVVMAATAVMAPPMPVPMTMAASDLNDRVIGATQRIGCCCGHSRRRHNWRKCKGTAGKSDYQKPFHFGAFSFVANASADYQLRFEY